MPSPRIYIHIINAPQEIKYLRQLGIHQTQKKKYFKTLIPICWKIVQI